MPPRRARAKNAAGGSGGAAAAAAAAPSPPRISIVHRHAFIQHLMALSYTQESNAINVLSKLVGPVDGATCTQLVSDINSDLVSLNFQIRTFRHPVDGQKYIGFINTTSDSSSKVATHFTHAQRDYFRAVYERIAADPAAENGVGFASTMELLNLEVASSAAASQGEGTQAAAAASSKRLTKQERQDTLEMLRIDGWLDVDAGRPNCYTIGVRTYLELGKSLMELDNVPDATMDAWKEFL